MRTTLLFALVAAAAACSTSQVRDALYAPQFTYYEDTEIKSTMHRFAADVAAIRAHLSESDDEQRKEIPKLLADMEEAASELASTGEASNHPIFDQYLDDLRRDLAHARNAAERDPPDYTSAASITGACIACHRERR
jgi:C4-dicarboxylate-specific signal transduction histidine kinase